MAAAVDDLSVEILQFAAPYEVEGQLAELPEVVAAAAAGAALEDERHQRHLAVGRRLLGLEVEPVALDLGVAERFRPAAAVGAEEELGHHGVEVLTVRGGGEVAVAGGLAELAT